MSQEIQSVLSEIKAGVGAFDSKLEKIHQRIDGLEQKSIGFPGSPQTSDLEATLKGSDDLGKLMRGERKSAILTFPSGAVNLKKTALESKSILTGAGVGSQTTGVMSIERLDGITGGAQRRNFMRSVLRVIPTTHSAVDFVRETSSTPTVSPQTEAGTKSEAALTFESAVAPVRTLAVWVPASRQILDDLAGLQQFIAGRLSYAVLREEDAQILFGSGTGVNLSGLATEADPFDTALLGSSWQRLDVIRRALQQVEAADEAPTGFIVLNPSDWGSIELTKSSTGEYLAGDPRSAMPPTLWGRPVVISTAMTSGHFLIGSSEAADIRMRQDLTVEISTEHADYFTRNLVAIRAEERLALPVYRPASLIEGTFSTSPA